MKLQVINVRITGNGRRDTMGGRKYWVFPVVILVEGVHHGSGGPVLYLKEDMGLYAPAWNSKPIVLYHPKKGNKYISANSPEVLTRSQIGILLHNRMKGKEQHAEAWIDEARVQAVNNSKLTKAISRGLQMEVSTGLFATFEEKEGKWKGKSYSFIAREYRPDHLAVLPDQIGACSLKDGCGMFTASKRMSSKKMLVLQRAFNKVLSGDSVSNCSCHKDKKMKKKKMTTSQKKRFVDNLIEGSPVWEEDDRDDLLAMEDSVLKKLKKKDDAVIEANEEEEAREERKEKARKLKLKLKGAANKGKDDDEDEEEEETKSNKKKSKDKKKAKSKDQDVAMNTFLKTVPVGLRGQIKAGLAANAAERDRLTDIILSNDANEFEEEELEALDVPSLKKIASFACHEKDEDDDEEDDDEDASYSRVDAPRANRSNGKGKEEPLALPTLNLRPKKRDREEDDE